MLLRSPCFGPQMVYGSRAWSMQRYVWALPALRFVTPSTMTKSTAPYGTWSSPISPEVVLKSVRELCGRALLRLVRDVT